MIDLETLAASCATMADEIVARGSSDTFRYDADGVLEFGDNPEYYSPLSSAVTRSAFPETAREYGYTREYLEQAERRLLACVIGYCALDGELASIRDGGEDRDGFRVNPLDVHEVLLCARTARSEQGPIADRVLDSASMRLKTFFALSMPMADAATGLPGDEAEGGKHYHRAAAPDDGARAAEEE